MVQWIGFIAANIPSSVGFATAGKKIFGMGQAVTNIVTFQVSLSDPLSDGAAWCLIKSLPCYQGGTFQDSITIPDILVSQQNGCFKIRNVLGDGRCLFRALALLSTGHEHKYAGLLQQIISHIKDHWQSFQTYLTLGHQDQSFTPDSYSMYMQRKSSFGTIAELVAGAQVLQAHIRVFSIEGSLQISTRDALLSDMDVQTCYDLGFLGSQNAGHYVALELISGPALNVSQGSNAMSVATPDNAERKRKRSGLIGVFTQAQQFYARLRGQSGMIVLGPFQSESEAAVIHDFAASVCSQKLHLNGALQQARSISSISPAMLSQ